MKKEREYHLSIGGMSCAGCVSSVERALKSVQGVSEASVNFADHTAVGTSSVPAERLIKAVVDAGYEAAELQSIEDASEKATAERNEYRARLRQALVAGVVGFPLLLSGWMGYMPPLVDGAGGFGWPLVSQLWV